MTDDMTQQLLIQVTEMRGDIRALTARVDVQLEHGQRKMDELRRDVDALQLAMPDSAKSRMDALEDGVQRRSGMSSVWAVIISVAVSLAGSSAAAAVITYFLTRH